ncbi:hypothetical protein BXZ70DRAFT_911764 [Cristinia sonorae]|uniref:Uncharacterized protein n=1 Tax=Cristinia sonorae TaxID=1940300 RepID=A0A8K0V0V5_9AGAR|nr:hypothetical protein BXZ70DRAFT_911764 [Cristinia sonorae]
MSHPHRIPLELVLLLISIANTFQLARSAQVDHLTNENATCEGSLAALNSLHGVSPCTTYQLVRMPCGHDSPLDMNDTACDCNVVAYNLANACLYCGGSPIQSWTQWAVTYSCDQTSVPPSPVYELPYSDDVPRWAYSPVPIFDARAAILSTTETKWTPIQIALPILSAVATLIVAAIVFFLWRRSQKGPKGKPRSLGNAHLQGRRWFFGLFRHASPVRRRTLDTTWEIDESSQHSHPFTPLADSTASVTGLYDPHSLRSQGHSPQGSYSYDPTAERPLVLAHSRQGSYEAQGHRPSGFGHSPQPSYSSSTPTLSQLSFKTTSGLSNLLRKLTWSRSSHKYRKGITKSPEYKRVNVIPDTSSSRFRIDGEVFSGPEEASGSGGSGEGMGATRSGGSGRQYMDPYADLERGSHLSKAPTLPSVLDIRYPPPMSAGEEISSVLATASGESPGVGGGTASALGQPRSDFSLTTNDLMTPTTTDFSKATYGSSAFRAPSPSILADSDILSPTMFSSAPPPWSTSNNSNTAVNAAAAAVTASAASKPIALPSPSTSPAPRSVQIATSTPKLNIKPTLAPMPVSYTRSEPYPNAAQSTPQLHLGLGDVRSDSSAMELVPNRRRWSFITPGGGTTP